MPNNNLHADLIKSVTKAVNILYAGIARRLGSARYPSEIIQSLQTLPVDNVSGQIVGTVKVSGETVWAYEWGSGLWSEIGPRGKYPILPVDASILAFNWPAAQEAAAFSREGRELVVPGEGGQVFLPGIMHPGIRAKPYIRPAIEENIEKIVDVLGDDVLISLSASLGPDVVVIK